jgi:hypothetical protein
MTRKVGEVVHVDVGWPCRHAIVVAPRRRGLDLMVGAPAVRFGVLEAVPHGKPGLAGTWHRRCPDADGGRLGRPRGHYRMRRA